MKKQFQTLMALLFAMLATTVSYADRNIGMGNASGSPNGGPNPQRVSATQNNCTQGTSRAELNANNVRCLILNGGDMFWDLVGNPRFEIPKVPSNSNEPSRNAIFCAGVWIGGLDTSTRDILVLAQTYRQGGQVTFWPGPLDTITGTTERNRCSQWNQHWQLEKSVVRAFVDFANRNPGAVTEADIPDAIKYWPGRGNPLLPLRPNNRIDVANLRYNTAKFIDRNGDQIYNPLDGDYPQLPGDLGLSIGSLDAIDGSADQMLFWVTNDRGNVKNFGANRTGQQIGMEVHTEAFQYVEAGPRNDMVFLRNKLINKGGRILDSCWFGQWVDPDLGYAYDDYVGCDVPRGLGICYNGDDFDEGLTGYGFNPPSLGVDFFFGPIADRRDRIDNDKDGQVDEGTNGRDDNGNQLIDELDEQERIIMSNFLYYNNTGGDSPNPKNGNPTVARDYYNYLQNKWRDGTGASYDMSQGLSPVGSPVSGIPGYTTAIRARYLFPGNSDQNTCWSVTDSLINGRCPIPGLVLPDWSERTARSGTGTVGNPPGDRRFLSSAGPFTLRPGATNELIVGIVWARATSGGSTGSFGQLLRADDLAQITFDRNFAIIVGPPEPRVDITELNGELIMSITPDTVDKSRGIHTENFVRFDGAKLPAGGDRFYRFQGYKIYQLKDDRVSTNELNNPDRARLIAQCDIRDGVGRISNLVFDPQLLEEAKELMVDGADRGLFHTLRIRQDAFNPERSALVNFKRYYFRVIAYANSTNLLAKDPYLQSTPRKSPVTGQNIEFIEAIPHQSAPEFGGTELGARYNQEFDITRVTGSGNGGVVLDSIKNLNVADSLLKSPFRQNLLTYNRAGSPVAVRVYNPKRVRDADFELKLTTRVQYKPGAYRFREGDTIVSLIPARPRVTIRDTQRVNGQITFFNTKTLAGFLDFAPGRARVLREVKTNTDGTVELEVDMFNDEVGGRFTLMYESTIQEFNPSNPGRETFEGYTEEEERFIKKGELSTVAIATQTQYYDYWRVIDLTAPNVPVLSEKPVSEAGETLIPKYGIAVELSRTDDPGVFVQINRINGTQRSFIRYADRSRPWVLTNFPPPPSQIDPRITQSEVDAGYPFANAAGAVDPELRWRGVNSGYMFPYVLGRPFSSGNMFNEWSRFGGNSTDLAPDGTTKLNRTGNTTLQALNNVDVVLTNDTSKWTKVVVLQRDSFRIVNGSVFLPSGIGSAFQMNKSRAVSKDRDGIELRGVPSPWTNSPRNTRGFVQSRGVSWFPGYAIDLDKGIRLNMMFMESIRLNNNRAFGGIKGNDLKYEFPNVGVYLNDQNLTYPRAVPSSIDAFPSIRDDSRKGDANFVYVLNTPYDEAISTERELDSVVALSNNSTERLNGHARFFDKVTWIVNPWTLDGLGGFGEVLSTEATLSGRVNKAYRPYPTDTTSARTNPTYRFSTRGLQAKTNVVGVAKSALDLIRVVPNPYYAYSPYEGSQVDTRILITNLPTRCSVNIYNLNGTLVRSFPNIDRSTTSGENQTTFLEWDLKNQFGIPIASGAYLIHIDAGSIGEKVVKWFGAMRPTDLSGLTNSGN